MFGPEIVARTLSRPTARGASPKEWQYHGRSDAHSKVACWAVLFDMLNSCDIFRTHAEERKISFAVNHLMVGPINKKLDLVVCAPNSNRLKASRRSFAELAAAFRIVLSRDEAAILAGMPQLEGELSHDVSEVLIALEAKACFTDLVKSIPRLHAEILATGYLAKQAAPSCLTVSYTLVNGATTFMSPGKAEPSDHNQPSDARNVMEMIRKAIPRAAADRVFGYDAIGATLVECRNDGSRVAVAEGDPAPSTSDFINYGRMISSLCGAYRHRFGNR